MASTNTKTYKFSPFGAAVHPWVNKPDTKFNAGGVFKTGLRCPMTDALVRTTVDEIQAASEAYLAEVTAEMTPAERKKWSLYVPFEEEEDDEGNKTGFVTFDFKQNATLTLKSGEVKEVSVGLYDAKNQETKAAVFGGSVIRVKYSMRGIKMTSAKEAGVRLDFAAVQIKELAKRSSGGGGGFGEIEGGFVDDGDVPDEVGEEGGTKTPSAGAVSGDY